MFVHLAKYCQCSELSEITMGMAFARTEEAESFLRRLECNITADPTEPLLGLAVEGNDGQVLLSRIIYLTI